MIPHQISWWDISVVQVIQVIQVIQMIQVIQVIQLIQVMQVRLAHLWPDFRVILHTIWDDSDYLVVCAFLRLNRRDCVVKLSSLCILRAFFMCDKPSASSTYLHLHSDFLVSVEKVIHISLFFIIKMVICCNHLWWLDVVSVWLCCFWNWWNAISTAVILANCEQALKYCVYRSHRWSSTQYPAP